MDNAKEYLLQHFQARPNVIGAKENSDAYNARLYWFENDYPTYKEVNSHFNWKGRRTENYAYKYDWNTIRANYDKLVKEQELKDLEKDQKKWEKNFQKSNEITFNYCQKRREHLLYILNELPNNPAPKRLDAEEEQKARNELKELNKELRDLQPIMRTNLHLTNKYNDTQQIESNTNINGDLDITHFHKKTTEEVLKENESEIGEFIRRAIKQQD